MSAALNILGNLPSIAYVAAGLAEPLVPYAIGVGTAGLVTYSLARENKRLKLDRFVDQIPSRAQRAGDALPKSTPVKHTRIQPSGPPEISPVRRERTVTDTHDADFEFEEWPIPAPAAFTTGVAGTVWLVGGPRTRRKYRRKRSRRSYIH